MFKLNGQMKLKSERENSWALFSASLVFSLKKDILHAKSLHLKGNILFCRCSELKFCNIVAVALHKDEIFWTLLNLVQRIIAMRLVRICAEEGLYYLWLLGILWAQKMLLLKIILLIFWGCTPPILLWEYSIYICATQFWTPCIARFATKCSRKSFLALISNVHDLYNKVQLGFAQCLWVVWLNFIEFASHLKCVAIAGHMNIFPGLLDINFCWSPWLLRSSETRLLLVLGFVFAMLVVFWSLEELFWKALSIKWCGNVYPVLSIFGLHCNSFETNISLNDIIDENQLSSK